MDRAEAVDQLKNVYRVLSEDMTFAKKLSIESPSPFSYRALIKTFFSLVEGLSYQLRQVTLATLEPHPGRLTTAEIALLKEEKYSLNNKGESESSESFQRALPSILFSIRSYLKNHGASFEPDISTVGWQAMRRAVEVRNRITHPKSVADLTIMADDLRNLIQATEWWSKTLYGMFDACDEADRYWNEKLKQQDAAS